MPTIPVSNNNTVQRQEFRSGGFNVTAKAPVGNAEAINALGDVVNSVDSAANRMQKIREEEARARQRAMQVNLDGHDRFAVSQADELYWNKDTGFVNRRGQDANKSFDDVVKRYSDDLETSASELGTVELQNAARLANEKHIADFKTRLNKRIYEENEKFEVEEAGRNLQTYQDTAINNYNSDQPEKSIMKIRSLIYGDQERGIPGYRETMNLTDTQAKDLENKYTSGIVNGVVTSYLSNGQIDQANAAFDKAKKSGIIDSKTNEDITKKLQAENERKKAQIYAAKIIESGMNLGDSIAEARKIEDPTLQDAVVQRVINRYEEKKKFELEAEEAEFGAMLEQANAIGDIRDVPADKLKEMSSKKRTVMSNILKMIAKGHQPKTDPVVYEELMVMASTPSLQNEFLKTSINDYADKLSNADRERFLSMRKSIINGDGKHDADFGQFLSDSQTIKNSLVELGITGKDDQAKFSSAVQQRAIQWQKANGKKNIPQDELKKITNALASEVVVQGAIWNHKKKVFEVEPEDTVIGVSYDGIPDEERAQIIEAFKQTGKPFSEDEATKVYQQYLKRVLK